MTTSSPKLIAAIIRHGDYHQLPQVPSAHQPFPLNEEGEQQSVQGADSIRKTLNEYDWTLHSEIDSSQLLRAWQTAQIIGKQLADLCSTAPQISSYDALAERCVGSAANLTVQQIEEIVRNDPRFDELPGNWKSDSHFRLPLQGAESLMDAGQRVAKHMHQQMETLAAQTQTDTLKLFIGHGAAFRHAAHHLGVLEFEEIAKLSMYHATPVYLQYMPDGHWRHITGEWKIRKKHSEYND